MLCPNDKLVRSQGMSGDPGTDVSHNRQPRSYLDMIIRLHPRSLANTNASIMAIEGARRDRINYCTPTGQTQSVLKVGHWKNNTEPVRTELWTSVHQFPSLFIQTPTPQRDWHVGSADEPIVLHRHGTQESSKLRGTVNQKPATFGSG